MFKFNLLNLDRRRKDTLKINSNEALSNECLLKIYRSGDEAINIGPLLKK
jgi:hypothetical protein